MATKRFYATGAFRYGTRMMVAGDPVDLTAPQARLYRALNKISETRPKTASAPAPAPAPAAPVAPKAAPKKAPAKRKAKKAAPKK